jgi:cysteine desulfurase
MTPDRLSRGSHPTVPTDSPVYLDWNSTTPISNEVLAAMRWAAENAWANPSSVHSLGRQSKSLIENVRGELAEMIGARPSEVVFTAGGTESNNYALAHAPGLVLSTLEHPSVTRQAERLADMGRPVRWLEVCPNGQVDVDSLSSCLCDMPPGSRVAVMAVNHETGVIQPLETIASVVHQRGAWLHVDAVQALGKTDPGAWSCWDTVSVGAHKVRGPKGIGALAWKCGVPIPRPLLVGGTQEWGIRPGTVDPILVAGFGAALEHARASPSQQCRLKPLRNQFELATWPLAEPNVCDDANRLDHVASLYVRGWSGAELAAALDLEGICVSAGSACAAGTAEVSPVIAAMLGVERARSTIRVSLGETTTEWEIQRAIEAFHRVMART